VTKQRKLAYLALLINTVVWGAALPIVKPALEFVTPFQYLFYRYLLAAMVSLPILVYLICRLRPSLTQLMTIVGLEVIGVVGALSFLYEGLKRTSSLEATLIANAAPILVIVGGILFLKEKEEPQEFVGLILALIGMLILTLEPLFFPNGGKQASSVFGNMLVIGHNLLWAVYLLLAKRVYRKVPKLLVGLVGLWVGLIGFYLLFMFATPMAALPQVALSGLRVPSVLIASLYMGIFGSLIGWTAYIYGNDKIEASEASLFGYLQPLVTIPLATLWLKERLNLVMVAALILTTVGVFIAERRPPAKRAVSKTKR